MITSGLWLTRKSLNMGRPDKGNYRDDDPLPHPL